MSKPLELELIRWNDSVLPTAKWCFISELDPVAVATFYTVGWVLGENDDCLRIAATVGGYGDDDLQCVPSMEIPKRAIVARKIIGTFDGLCG